MTLLVRDEEDIVEANLDFHLSFGVDFVVATDNGSEDSTPEILQRYERDGFLHLIHEPTHDYSQHRWVTHMARLAASRFGADWVINNDADEFWIPAGSSIPSVLATVPRDVDVVVARRHNVVARRHDSSGPETNTVRHRVSVGLLGNPLGPKVAHRGDPAIVVLQGNHEVERPDPGETVDDGRLEILHYPIRTREQFERSVIQGGEAYLANRELPVEVGDVRRRLYERWQAGEFPALWVEQTASDDEIADGMSSGRFLEDRRVAERLAELPTRSPARRGL